MLDSRLNAMRIAAHTAELERRAGCGTVSRSREPQSIGLVPGCPKRPAPRRRVVVPGWLRRGDVLTLRVLLSGGLRRS